MKNKSSNLRLFALGAIICLIAVACSKDRVTQDSFSPMDAFYNKYKQQEQVFTITDTGTGPCIITGAQGTKIYNVCDSSAFIRPSDSSAITYNYQLGLVEIYSVKDMILWPAPSLAGSQLLQTAADVRVRIFKGADNYVLRPARNYEMTMNDSAANSVAMSVYDGAESATNIDWSADAKSSLTVSPPLDSLNVFNMGWVSCARPRNSTGTAILTATVAGTGTDNIGVFIVFKNFKSVMKVTHLVSAPIPVGEPFTFIAMALNQNNQYVLDKRDITLTGSLNISLSFQAVSETDLINMLSGL